MFVLERSAALERLKILGREPADTGKLYTAEVNLSTNLSEGATDKIQGLNILCQHGFDSTSLINSRDALRCLANALFLVDNMRQIFVDSGYTIKAVNRLKVSNCVR
jgi:hypothetical protein